MSPSSSSRPPVRAIVARFSSPPAREVIENVLREYPFEFCALMLEGKEPQFFSGLPREAQEWLVSAEIRGCEYAGTDWNSLAPLDAEIIEKMRDAEAIFMDTVTRLEWKRAVPYATRKRWYLQHLRFWNDYLTRKKINLFLSAWIPHQLPDVLLYQLCRVRGIPTLFFHTTLVQDVSFAASTVEDPAPVLKDRYEALIRSHAGVSNPDDIPLEPLFEARYQSLITERRKSRPWRVCAGRRRPTESGSFCGTNLSDFSATGPGI